MHHLISPQVLVCAGRFAIASMALEAMAQTLPRHRRGACASGCVEAQHCARQSCYSNEGVPAISSSWTPPSSAGCLPYHPFLAGHVWGAGSVPCGREQSTSFFMLSTSTRPSTPVNDFSWAAWPRTCFRSFDLAKTGSTVWPNRRHFTR